MHAFDAAFPLIPFEFPVDRCHRLFLVLGDISILRPNSALSQVESATIGTDGLGSDKIGADPPKFVAGADPLDAVTRLLSDLVAIPSVNPMGRQVSGPGFFEAGMTEYLTRFFEGLGVLVDRQEAAPGRWNVLARYEAPGSRRTIVFDAHQDTVPTDGMVIEPFHAVVESGRLYGRGACDVKAGMAAMLLAFRRLVRERPEGSASVVMACTVDEEFTHVGSSLLAKTPLGADLAIVAEPTRLDVVNTHKGAVRWKIRTTGVACHSATPELGENAIYRMASVVGGLRDLASELSRSRPDAILGTPSLSVGRIVGGQSVNVVPDFCEIEVDRRLIPGEDEESARKSAWDFLADRLGGANWVEFLPPFVTMPALSTLGSTAWVEPVRGAISRVLGRDPGVVGVPYGTDAGPLAANGLPSLVIGPGDIAQAHTKDEWVDLEEVKMAVDVYFEIARSLGEVDEARFGPGPSSGRIGDQNTSSV